MIFPFMLSPELVEGSKHENDWYRSKVLASTRMDNVSNPL